jgi:hypothetical protein
MTEEEVVGFMLESFNSDNREICLANNMDEDQVEEQIARSQDGLLFMIYNVVKKMEQKGLIKLD